MQVYWYVSILCRQFYNQRINMNSQVIEVSNDECPLAIKIYHTQLNKGAVNLAEAINQGMIPKNKLVDNATYRGYCRNANLAVWRAESECFEYTRHKFGSSITEKVKHPEDDDGFDVFVPTFVI